MALKRYKLKIYDEEGELVEDLIIGDSAYNQIIEAWVCNNYQDDVIEEVAP